MWLVFHKRHTGRPSISYQDALDEALCHGWVDSLVKRLDDDRYARKFTPRKPDSSWSDINRKRYAELAASGRLAPPGLDRAPTARVSRAPPKHAWSGRVPRFIQERLAKHPKAQRTFNRLPTSQRRRYVLWIDIAKQEATKLRRLDEAIRLLEAGKPLGLK